MKLSEYNARRCFTVSGILIQDGKVLLVKHKMLGIWLAPGGHVEPHELPHQAAEREFFEETGVKVRAVSAYPSPPRVDTEHLPMPFLYNLHWINKPGEKKARSNGEICEQHYLFAFFVTCDGDCNLRNDDPDHGIDEIRWFSREELSDLEMWEDIRQEIYFAFDHYPELLK